MHSRCCAVLSACISIVAVGELFAQTTSSEILLAVHQDWTGYVTQSVTRDGSVLSEYSAQTTSVNMEGAVFSVSMIPRFTCVPVSSIAVKDSTIVSRAADVELTVVVDSQTMDYPSILDIDGPVALFSSSFSVSNQEKLRSNLDLASWATFMWSVDTGVPRLSTTTPEDSPIEVGGNIDFSLLGSRRTIEAMEEMCRSHTPIPLTN
ncbi:MAG: hypothetical protein ACI9UN_000922 [Granulosicoccus sp.]|jgi:hypothetical protein